MGEFCRRPAATIKLLHTAALLGLVLATSALGETKTLERPQMVFTCLTQANQLGFQYFEKTHRKIFADMGYEFRLEHSDKDQALAGLKSGKFDGDCGRHSDFIKLTGLNHLIRASYPFRVISFNLWYGPNTPSDKPRKSLSVGYNNNLLFIRPTLERMDFRKLKGLPNETQIVNGLVNGSFDATISFGTAMEPFSELILAKGIRNEGPALSVPVYTLLHDRHAALVDDYNRRLKQALIERPFKPPFSARIPQRQANEIIFSCSVPKDSNRFALLEQVYSEAFNALGYKFRLISLPRVRESAELNRQNIAGSCGRTSSFLRTNPKAVAVNIPAAYANLRIWSRSPNEIFTSIADIPPRSRIGYVRGSSAIEQGGIVDNHPRLSFLGVTNTAVGIKMLDAKRIDYYLGFKINTINILTSITTRNSIYSAGDIDGEKIVPILTEQWGHLATDLERELKLLMEKHNANKLTDIAIPLTPL